MACRSAFSSLVVRVATAIFSAWRRDSQMLQPSTLSLPMNKPDRILTDAASYCAERPLVRVNGRAYAWPKHPAVVIITVPP